MPAELVQLGPLYQTVVDYHLPKDHLWGRPETVNPFPHTIQARSPDALWQSIMRDSLMTLGFTDDNFIVGLLVNLVNTFPDVVREATAAGIIGGLGLTFQRKDGELVAEMSQQFTTLDGERPSGLVVPEGAL